MQEFSKHTVVSILRAQIRSLEDMVQQMEHSSLPELYDIERLPELLRQRRESLDIDLHEITGLAGVSENTYRQLEKEGSNPRLQTLKSVGNVLNFKLRIELL